MGDIADAMLDGTLCEGCGEYIGSDAGFPQYCSPQCAADRGAPSVSTRRRSPRPPRRHGCPDCDRRFRTASALNQHWRDKHGGAA